MLLLLQGLNHANDYCYDSWYQSLTWKDYKAFHPELANTGPAAWLFKECNLGIVV